MTPEEAKTKWCPFARIGVAHSGAASFNRVLRKGETTGIIPIQSCCIADDCMAWRWVTSPEQAEKNKGPEYQEYYETLDKNYVEQLQTPNGICGMTVGA